MPKPVHFLPVDTNHHLQVIRVAAMRTAASFGAFQTLQALVELESFKAFLRLFTVSEL